MAEDKKVNWREVGISASGLSDWMTCRQMSKLRKQGWTPRRTPYPLNYGRVAHEVLEAIHNLQRHGQKDIDAKGVVTAVTARIKKTDGAMWDEYGEQAFEQIRAQLLAVMPAYVEYYKKKPEKWLSIEGKFRVAYAGTHLNGRFDAVFEKKDGLYLLDTKNKSETDVDGDVLLRDIQINFYLLVLWVMTKKFPKGFIYNIIRRPGLKLGKSESIKSYCERIEEHIKEKGPEYYFQRYNVQLTKDDVIDFDTWLKKKLPEYFEWCETNMPTELYGQPCAGRYGPCVYVPICYNNEYVHFNKTDFSKKGGKK